MSWALPFELDAACRAALAAGRPAVYVCPPAAWTSIPLFDQLRTTPEAELLVGLVPGPAEGRELAEILATRASLGPVCLGTALGRTARRLAAGRVRTLVVSPGDALELTRRSQLAPAGVGAIVLMWPETHLALERSHVIDTLFGEFKRCTRAFVTADHTKIGDLLERHAYRAPVQVVSAPPEEPLSGIRYALVPHDGIRCGVRATLDVLNPGSALVWDPSPLNPPRWAEYDGDPLVTVTADPGAAAVDLAIAAELPTAEALRALQRAGSQVVVLAHPAQLPYLQRLAHPLGVVRLPSEVDRARDRATDLRRIIRERLRAPEYAAELYALAPLFDEYDAALVAAAALQVSLRPEAPRPGAPGTHWIRVRLDLGHRDRIRPGDVVGALINAVGLTRHEIGRVDIREGFTIVDIRAEAAERAAYGLDGLVLRGREVGARLE